MLTYIIAKLVVAYYLLIIAHYVLQKALESTQSKVKRDILKRKTLMIVFGSGGHTTEMLMMLEKFDVNRYGRVIFVLGHSDKWSLTKIKDFYASRNIDLDKVVIKRVFRAREVKQSYVTSVVTTLIGILHAFWLVAQGNPDLLVTNGPGTALPLCYASFICNKVLLLKPRAKQIYIESFCRVKSLSLAGRLLKPIMDRFVV